jgi:Acetyltransferases, including N-acetylases of ribosomal proteins
MNHLGTVILETERLILRPFTLEDAPAMYTNWACDPEVTRHLTWPAHDTVEVSRAVLAEWVPLYEKHDYYHWAIVLRALGEPMGDIAAMSIKEDTRAASLGYCIGQRWWHRGYTSEALRAVIDFLFGQVGMNRIQAYHDVQNPHSGDVMAKCGMVYEGTLRQGARSNQGLTDVALRAVLKQDWKG